MTLAEITAKLTGLSADLESLKADKASAQSALAAEVEARKGLETKLSEAQAELARIKAAAPPAKDDNEEASVNDAIKALENAITVLKGIAGQGASQEKDDEEKAEDGADAMDDEEAKKASASKNFRKVLAIRAAQHERKKTFAAKRGEKVQAAKIEKIVTEKVTAQIASLGIPAPLALNKDGKNPIRAEKPDGRKRAHRLIATGFSEQTAVASLSASLGRK